MFSSLSNVCERISICKTKNDRLEEWKRFYGNLTFGEQFDAFNVIRLVIPKFDKKRASYGLKENTLAKKYIDTLCISKTSAEAQRLLNFKVIKGTKDLPEAIYHITQKRCTGKREFSISEINALLDGIQMYVKDHNDKVNKLIGVMVHEMMPIQQKWLCRIILKELRLGLSERAILLSIDKDAEVALSVCSDLQKICENIGSLSKLCGGIELGQVFKPMLADRVTNLEKIGQLMKTKPFFVETKYDGERMQVHKRGDKYLYYSRGSREYNQIYGETRDSGSLTPHIHTNILAHNCILDGEIIVYDLLNSSLVTKASGRDARRLREESDPRFLPCFVAYDIVLHNDRNLTLTPFSERRKMLECTIKEKTGYMYLSKQTTASTYPEVLDELNRVIDNGDEGLVVKEPSSVYAPDQRVDGGWYKIKTDYLDLMNDTVDVVIIGGYYGRNSGSGMICHYLCGILNAEGKYASFCKVSSGLTKSDMDQKLSKLEAYWFPFDRNNIPESIQLSRTCREKPAMIIDPSNSVVLEVKGAELMGTGFFSLPLTLRFPRVVCVRDDKDPEDCTKLSELQSMQLTNKRGIAKVQLTSSSPKKKIKVGRSAGSSSKVEPATVRGTELQGREFCVLSSSDDIPKHEAELTIREHSGSVVATPVPSCTVICGKQSISVQNVIKQGKHLILDIKWLKLNKTKLHPCPPYLVIHCPGGLKEQTFVSFDEYGDSFTVPVKPDDLKSLFQRIELPSEEECQVNPEAFLSLKNKYPEFTDFWRVSLKGMVILTRDTSHPLVSLAGLYGAEVTENPDVDGITHKFKFSSSYKDDVRDLSDVDFLETLKELLSEDTYNAFKETVQHEKSVES